MIDVKFEDKNKANEILKYGIRMCQGGCCKCPDNVRFSLILSLIDDLKVLGAWWQSKCLRWHLHRALKGTMTPITKKEGGVSKKKNSGGDVLVWYKNIP